ncbi:MAG: hypothetical protein ACOX6T_25770 [Myxococcales bacterium]|jgi:hypothetical protein
MRTSRAAAFGLALLVTLGLSGCTSQGEVCCDCLMNNDCWDYELCPSDPRGSCEWVLTDDADRPSYAEEDDEVCYSVLLTCTRTHCATECKGEVAGVE